MSDVHAVILAGGSGSRLWSLSRQQLPKQFLALDGGASLLQTTIDHLSTVIGADSILIVRYRVSRHWAEQNTRQSDI